MSTGVAGHVWGGVGDEDSPPPQRQSRNPQILCRRSSRGTLGVRTQGWTLTFLLPSRGCRSPASEPNGGGGADLDCVRPSVWVPETRGTRQAGSGSLRPADDVGETRRPGDCVLPPGLSGRCDRRTSGVSAVVTDENLKDRKQGEKDGPRSNRK